jgi:hypothetical protein
MEEQIVGARKEEQTPMQRTTANVVMVSIMMSAVSIMIILGSVAALVIFALFGE